MMSNSIVANGESNRIIFHGNPWPDGHMIDILEWSGRLDPKKGIFFDLHLVTASYNADDEDEENEDGDDEDEDPWERKNFWMVYNNCTMSSVEWNAPGFFAGTDEKQLNFRDHCMEFTGIDTLPPPFEDRAFHLYLLGHDGVADHEITFRKNSTGTDLCDDNGAAVGSGYDTTYTLDWRGKIAREYVEDDDFRYTFHAHHEHLKFKGIKAPEGMEAVEAIEIARKYCVTPLVKAVKQPKDGTVWLVPNVVTSPSSSTSSPEDGAKRQSSTQKRKI